MNNHIIQLVENCVECAKNLPAKTKPLMTTPLPEYPWQIIGTDLFELKGANFLLVVDYFSRYPEVLQ